MFKNTLYIFLLMFAFMPANTIAQDFNPNSYTPMGDERRMFEENIITLRDAYESYLTLKQIHLMKNTDGSPYLISDDEMNNARSNLRFIDDVFTKMHPEYNTQELWNNVATHNQTSEAQAVIFVQENPQPPESLVNIKNLQVQLLNQTAQYFKIHTDNITDIEKDF